MLYQRRRPDEGKPGGAARHPEESRSRRRCAAASPRAFAVANKPGTLEGVEVDAGIVYVQGRPYVLSVMTTYLTQNAAGEAAITAVSQAAFEYFDRLAKSSEYGRAIR